MAMSQYGTQTALVGKMVFLALSQGDHDLVGGIPIPLKNDGVRQWEGLSHILWKIKNVPSHQQVMSFDPWKDDSDRKRMLDSVSIVER